MLWLTGEQRGVVYAIASGMLFGLLGYFGVTLMHAHLSIYTMLFWRFVVGALAVGMLLVPQYKTLFHAPKELLKITLYGILFYSPTAILYFMACKYIGTGLAMATFFVYPVIVILLNKILYNTIVPRIYYGIVVLMMVGMILLADIETENFDCCGLLLGLASALTYSFYVILSKKSDVAPLPSTLMVSIGCIVTCFCAALYEGSLFVPQGIDVWIKIVGVGLLCTALPMLLLLKALKYISSEKASLLSVLEPIFVLIFGVLLLEETITLLQVVGIVIVLCGALMTFGKKK